MAALYLTAPEAASATGKHPVTVRKALEADELHGFQSGKGGRWSIKPDCLEAWVENRLCAHKSQNVTPINQKRSASA